MLKLKLEKNGSLNLDWLTDSVSYRYFHGNKISRVALKEVGHNFLYFKVECNIIAPEFYFQHQEKCRQLGGHVLQHRES